jgi:integrase
MKKLKTRFHGVRFYEHKSRLYNRRPDRYFSIRYQLHGKQTEEGLGWASEGWTDEKAHTVLCDLKSGSKIGEGQTLSEKREKLIRDRRQRESQGDTIRKIGERYLAATVPPALTEKNHAVEKRICLNHIFRLAGERPALSFSEMDMQRFKNELMKSPPQNQKRVTAGRTLAPRTVEHVLIVLGKILKFAGVKKVPRARPTKYDNKNQRYLSNGEAYALLAMLRRENQQVHDMALLSLETGMRQGEILALLVSHCDFATGAISVVDSKNRGKNRTVFMPPGSRGMLQRNTKGKGNDKPVFCSERGGRHRSLPTVYYRVIKDLGFNDGVTDRRFRVDFHTLRHTYASWLIMSGRVSLYQLQKLLGHESITTTERYAHLAPANLAAAASVMGEIRAGG